MKSIHNVFWVSQEKAGVKAPATPRHSFATQSIASLIQRVVRSGRREGEKSHLLLYATDAWNLLQSLAC